LEQINFFLKISWGWPNFFFWYKIQFLKGLDVGKAIFGFCQHLGPIFFCFLGVTTLPSCRVMSSPLSLLSVNDEFEHLGVKSSLCDIFKKFWRPVQDDRHLTQLSRWIFKAKSYNFSMLWRDYPNLHQKWRVFEVLNVVTFTR
jgi:hypothetical protein